MISQKSVKNGEKEEMGNTLEGIEEIINKNKILPVGVYLFSREGDLILSIKWKSDVAAEDEKIGGLISTIVNLSINNLETQNKEEFQSIKLRKATYLFRNENNFIFVVAFSTKSMTPYNANIFKFMHKKIPFKEDSLEKVLMEIFITVCELFPLNKLLRIDFGEKINDDLIQRIYSQLNIIL